MTQPVCACAGGALRDPQTEIPAAPRLPLLEGSTERPSCLEEEREKATAAGEAGDTPTRARLRARRGLSGVGPEPGLGTAAAHRAGQSDPARVWAGLRVTALLFASAVRSVSCSSLSISCFLFLVANLGVPAWLANRGYSSLKYVHLSKDLATKNTAGYFSVMILKLYQRTDQHCLRVLPQPAMGQARLKLLLSGLGNSTIT